MSLSVKYFLNVKGSFFFFFTNLVFTDRCEGEYGKEEWARGGVEECKRDVKKILEELGKKVKGVSKKILEEEWEREYGEEGKGGGEKRA